MNDQLKDLLIRAAKTFVQAFLASLAIGVTSVHDMDSLQALAIASAAAALSAAWNLLLTRKDSTKV